LLKTNPSILGKLLPMTLRKTISRRASDYLVLMRFEKPIGTFLLMWPTLWALWLANDGSPHASLVWVFVFGVFVMRSAGCVINDYADRDIDPKVARTEQRPLASGRVSTKEALGLFGCLCLIALLLLLQLPAAVWPWSIPALTLTIIYPFMKRFMQAPQLILGFAFSFSIPMAYVASGALFDQSFYLLLVANIVWVVVYDTAYAMSDREEDIKIGVKSTAIWFGSADRHVLGVLQLIFLTLWLVLIGNKGLDPSLYVALFIAAGMFVHQQVLIHKRQQAGCFQAFLNNGWLGGVLWFGLILAF
jgi:4-hydroxybenzoate polyprenyltransferase